MQSVFLKAFDCRDFFSGRGAHDRHAGTRRLSVHVYGTCAAEANAAAKFRSCQPQNVAQIPEQGHFRFTVEGLFGAIHFQLNHFSFLNPDTAGR